MLTGEKQPQLPPHALRDPLEDQLLGLLSAIHTHTLSVLSEVVLPRLLFHELFRLGNMWEHMLNKTLTIIRHISFFYKV